MIRREEILLYEGRGFGVDGLKIHNVLTYLSIFSPSPAPLSVFVYGIMGSLSTLRRHSMPRIKLVFREHTEHSPHLVVVGATMLRTADIKIAGLRDVAFVRSPVAHGRLRAVEIPQSIKDNVYSAADLTDVNPIRAVSGLAVPSSSPGISRN